MAEELYWEERLVEELAQTVSYPETPDLRASVLARIRTAEHPRHVPNRRLAVGAAALSILVASLVITVSRDARDAIAGFLGLAVDGEVIEILPTPPPGQTATPFPTAVAFDTGATRVTREQAAARTRIILPESLGEPLAYFLLPNSAPVVIIDYGAVQIWEMEYFADEYFIGKGIVGQGTVVQEVAVNEKPGYWVSGGERIVVVRRADGTDVAGTRRTVTAHALIWTEDRLYRRIEGAGTLEEALRLAAEIRSE